MIEITPNKGGYTLTVKTTWATLDEVSMTWHYTSMTEALMASRQIAESIGTDGDIAFPPDLVGLSIPDPTRSAIDLIDLLLDQDFEPTAEPFAFGFAPEVTPQHGFVIAAEMED